MTKMIKNDQKNYKKSLKMIKKYQKMIKNA